MSVTRTHAPSSAKRRLIARPMPLAAPLTIAILSFRLFPIESSPEGMLRRTGNAPPADKPFPGVSARWGALSIAIFFSDECKLIIYQPLFLRQLRELIRANLDSQACAIGHKHATAFKTN